MKTVTPSFFLEYNAKTREFIRKSYCLDFTYLWYVAAAGLALGLSLTLLTKPHEFLNLQIAKQDINKHECSALQYSMQKVSSAI